MGGNGSHKSDKNAFIFSFANKEIYYNSITNYSIYDNSGSGPRFGGGHDFYISSGCMSNNSSYDNSPHSYDTKGKKYALSGENSFQVKDHEVYELILV